MSYKEAKEQIVLLPKSNEYQLILERQGNGD